MLGYVPSEDLLTRGVCLLDPGDIVAEAYEAHAQILNGIRHLAGQGTQQERSTGF